MSTTPQSPCIESEQPLDLRLTYRGLVQRLAEHPDAATFRVPKDLPELSLEELAAVVRHYPACFIEAMADYDLELRDLTADTLDVNARFIDRYRLIGVHIVGALRLYVLPLVLKDIQAQCELNREADSIEAGNDHGDTLTADQRMAGELGMGRLLS